MTPPSPLAPRGPARPLSVAPMVDRTDRCFRRMMRAITTEVLLYTEMVSVSAALGPRQAQVLGFDPVERPLALQLGGDDPERLAEAARVATALGYDEIDLNCGCPSPRVQQGRFGVVLMKDPARVAACVEAMRAATSLPVTVKHRLGVDELDRHEDVQRFVAAVASAGADRLVVHARKAWLRGLSPKDNRTIPPLRHDWVHRLQREHPGLRFELNGGIADLDEAWTHLDRGIAGVMIGRAAYDDPMIFAHADARLRARAQGRPWVDPGPVTARDRIAVLRSLASPIEQALARGTRLSFFARHVMGLVHGLPGARGFRRRLGEQARDDAAGVEIYLRAVDALAEALATGRAAPSVPILPEVRA